MLVLAVIMRCPGAGGESRPPHFFWRTSARTYLVNTAREGGFCGPIADSKCVTRDSVRNIRTV